jgi:hypothetical protein
MATAIPGESRTFCLSNATSSEGQILDASNLAVITIAVVGTDLTTEVVAPAATTLQDVNDYCTTAPVTVPSAGDYYLDAYVDYDGLQTHIYEELTVRSPIVGGTTLGELRRRLGYRLGDVIVATATEAGTTTTFVDEKTLRRADNAYRSWEAYISSAAIAANVGETRFVQGSTQSGGVITLQPELPGSTAYGDVIELHGSAGVGWYVAEKHAAINDAIAQAGTMGGIETTATATDLFSRDSPLVTVPSQFRFLHHIEWLDSYGHGNSIPYAKGRNKSGWWTNRNGEIEISGDYRESADGTYIRFWGHGDHVPLEAEDDATLVNATWIIAAAGYYLTTGYGQDRNPEKMRSMVADLRQEMAVWRRAATRVRPASSVAVRGY